MLAEENKAIARRWFEEIYNKGDLVVADDIIGTNFVLHDPNSPLIRGPEGFKQSVISNRTAFPDIHFTVEDQIAEGDKVVTRWTVCGTHRGDLIGIAPTGEKVAVVGISIARMAGGKIVESWDSWDALGMMQQLGVVPPMGQDHCAIRPAT